jgi:hypothetical protein
VNKIVNSGKSRTPRPPTDMSDPEIDLKRAEEANKHMEENRPSFRAFMDRLRRMARAVGRDMKMLLVLALTLGITKHK